MKKLLLATVISVLSLNAAHAYQVELNGGIGYVGTDIPGGTDDTLNAGVSGTYYFNAVQGKTGPLAEAAFIERASNVSAGYGYNHSDTSDLRSHDFALGGEVYVPGTNFYAAANIGTTKNESVDVDGGALLYDEADDPRYEAPRSGTSLCRNASVSSRRPASSARSGGSTLSATGFINSRGMMLPGNGSCWKRPLSVLPRA